MRKLSSSDHALLRFDRLLRSLAGSGRHQRRPYPATDIAVTLLAPPARRHAAGLMRVNHSGEVCAQALYVGQSLLARSANTYDALSRAAAEEGDHLFWCETRLKELDARPSRLNVAWYGGALVLGLAASAAGDRWSMAFVEETERQVVRHLDGHLEALPADDLRSRAVVEHMRADEARHAAEAAAGARPLPNWVARVMALQARVMTTLAYWV